MDEQVQGLFQAYLIVQHHAYIRSQAEVLQERKRQRTRRRYIKKRFWVRTWLTEDERVSAGQFHNLMLKVRNDDVQSFTNYLRKPPDMFQFLLNRLKPRPQKKDIKFRRPLEPGLKLAVETPTPAATGVNYPIFLSPRPRPHPMLHVPRPRPLGCPLAHLAHTFNSWLDLYMVLVVSCWSVSGLHHGFALHLLYYLDQRFSWFLWWHEAVWRTRIYSNRH